MPNDQTAIGPPADLPAPQPTPGPPAPATAPATTDADLLAQMVAKDVASGRIPTTTDTGPGPAAQDWYRPIGPGEFLANEHEGDLHVAVGLGTQHSQADAAKYLDLSSKLKDIPPSMVAEDPEGWAKTAQTGAIDWNALAQSPKFAAWVSQDPMRAGLTIADLPAFAEIERRLAQDGPDFRHLPNGMIQRRTDSGDWQTFSGVADLYQTMRDEGANAEAGQGVWAATHATQFAIRSLLQRGLGAAVGIPNMSAQADAQRRAYDAAAQLYAQSWNNSPTLMGAVVRGGVGFATSAPELAVETLAGGPVVRTATGLLRAATMGARISPWILRAVQGSAAMAPFAATGALKQGLDKGPGAAAASFAEDEAVAAAFGPVGLEKAAVNLSGEAMPSAFRSMARALATHVGLNLGQNTALDLAHRIQSYADGSDTTALDGHELLPALAADGVLGAAMGAVFGVHEGRARARVLAEIGDAQIDAAAAAKEHQENLQAIAAAVDSTKAAELSPDQTKDAVSTMAGDGPAPVINKESWHDHYTKAGEDPRAAYDTLMGPGAYDAAGTQLAMPIATFAVDMRGTPHQEWAASEMRADTDAASAREADTIIGKVASAKEEAKPAEAAKPKPAGEAPAAPEPTPAKAESAKPTPAPAPTNPEAESLHGRPDLANPGTTPELRASVNDVDEALKGRQEPRAGTDEELRAAAEKRASKEPDEIEREMASRLARKAVPNEAQVAEELALLDRRQKEYEAMPVGAEKGRAGQRLDTLIAMYRAGGTEAGRALRARFDRLMTPEQRLAAARLDARGPMDKAAGQRITDALQKVRDEFLKARLTERQGQRTQVARKPRTGTSTGPRRPVSPEVMTGIRSLKAQLARMTTRPRDFDPTRAGMAMVGPGGPAIDRIPHVLEQLAAQVMKDPNLGFRDFVHHVLDAAPTLRDRPADIEKAWDTAGGKRAADEVAKDAVAADDRARMVRRAAAVQRMIAGQIQRMKDDLEAMKGMTDEQRFAYLAGKAKSGLPTDLMEAMKPLVAERNELSRKLTSIRKATAPRSAEEQDAAAAEGEQKDRAKAELEAAQKRLDDAKKRAALSDAERTEQILKGRSDRAKARMAEPKELQKLHDELDDLRKQQRATDARLVPPTKKDIGPDQDPAARDAEHEAEITRERERAALDKRIKEVQERIAEHEANAKKAPAERAAEIKAARDQADAEEAKDRADNPELYKVIDELDEARKERDKADAKAMGADAETQRKKLEERIAALAERAQKLRERSTDPLRRAELEAARAKAAEQQAKKSDELKRAEAEVREWERVNARHDRELTRQPLTPVEELERAIRRENERGAAAAEKERALNEKLAAMEPDERREFLASRTKEETPEAIKAIRQESAERVTLLKAERERLAAEGMTDEQIAAAEITHLDRTMARARELEQQKLDAYRAMGTEELKRFLMGRLPTVAETMRRMADDEGRRIREQVRILERPAEVEDVRKARLAEVAARTALDNESKKSDAASLRTRERLKFMGFDLDDPNPEWVRNGQGYAEFQKALEYARGGVAHMVAEGYRNAMHFSAHLPPVKFASDVLNIVGELSVKMLDRAATADLGAMREVWRGITARGLWNSMRAFRDSLVTGVGDPAYGDTHGKFGYIPGRTGTVIRLSMRLVQAIDQGSKAMAAHAVVGMHAYDEAVALGLQGDALAKFIDDEIANTQSKSWEQARGFADRATFTDSNALTNLTGRLQMRNLDTGSPILDGAGKIGGAIFFPFTKVPTNIIARGVMNVPGMALLVHAAENAAHPLDKMDEAQRGDAKMQRYRQMREDMARAAIGTMVLGLVLAVRGKQNQDGRPLLTGFADRDHPAELFGMSYAKLGPAAHALGMLVDAVDAYQRGASLEGTLGTAGAHVRQESLLQNIQNFSKAMGDEPGFNSFLASLASAAVPAFEKEAARNANPDEVTHRGESAGAKLWDSITGGGATKFSPFGSVITKGTTGLGAAVDWANREVNPMRPGDVYDPRPAAQAMHAWNADHPDHPISEEQPSKTVEVKGKKVALSDEQYQRGMNIGGGQWAEYVAAYYHAAGIDPRQPTEEGRKAIEEGEHFRAGALRALAEGKDIGGKDAARQGAADGARGKWAPK